MVALSEDLGGDPRVVASMHLVRLVTLLLFLPTFVSLTFGSPAEPTGSVASFASSQLWQAAVLLLCGLLLGLIMRRLGVPSGDLLGAIVAAALVNPLWLKLSGTPAAWQLLAQMILGAGVGASVTRDTLRCFKPYALGGLAMTVILITVGLMLGHLLHAITDLDLVTALLGTAPGGAATITVLADPLGADAELVAAMHVSRMLILIVLQPALVRVAVWGEGRRLRQEG